MHFGKLARSQLHVIWLLTLSVWAFGTSLSHGASTTTYYISLAGSDSNSGEAHSPWRTLEKAREHLRLTKGTMNGDIIVVLRGGYYVLDQTFTLDDRDSGNNGHWIRYQAAPGETPIITGGRRIEGWQPESGGVWSAAFDFNDKIRDLWVNGVRMRMASNRSDDIGKIKGQGGWGQYPGTNVPTGIRFRTADIPNLQNSQDVELVTNRRWTYHILSVSSIQSDPAHPNQRVFRMQEPYFHYTQTTLWSEHHPHPAREFWVMNARELLTEPGEFYFNRSTKRMYYMPNPGEDLKESEIIAPIVAGLLKLSGRSMSQKIRNVEFSGIAFQHDAWRLVQIGTSRGASSNQGPKLIRFKGTFAEFEGDRLLPAAVELVAAENIHFRRNTFERLGGAGLNLINGVNHCVVEGNIFRDVGASAITISHPDHRELVVITQFVEEESCKDNIVRNNLIRATGVSFWAAPAIVGFFPTRLTLAHNDIADSTYSGISLGWAWNSWRWTSCRDNLIQNNRIFDVCTKLWDGGAIYLLGRQPGTSITGNHIGGSVDFGGIYADQGASLFSSVSGNVFSISAGVNYFFAHSTSTKDFSVRDNWTTSSAFSNGSLNVTLTNNTVFSLTNIPPATAQIISNAGLQPGYADLHTQMEQRTLPGWPLPAAYQQWAGNQYGAVVAGDENLRSSVWGPLAPENTANVPNLLAYAMGAGRPDFPSSATQAWTDGDSLVFRFVKDPLRGGVNLQPEMSESLTHWTSAAEMTTLLDSVNGLEVREVKIPHSSGFRFIRLRADWTVP